MNKQTVLFVVAWILSLTITGPISALDKGTDTEKIQVKGYTKKDGTEVKGYVRSKSSKGEKIEVKGYTKKDGTVVKGYIKTKPAN